MIITFNQIKIYTIVCTLISIFIYIFLSIYVIKNKGDRKSLINTLPMYLSFYISFLFSGIFIFFGLSIAYSIAFQNVNVIGATKSFAILFGVFFAYFPISIILSQLKGFAYNILMSCVQKYN